MQSIEELLSLIPRYDAMPAFVRGLLPLILSSIIVLVFVLILALFLVWLERKVSAHMQDRLGPMYVGGWHGWAQTLADALKLLLKEDIIPAAADVPLFKMAPVLVFVASFASFVVIPFGVSSIASDLNIGILYIVAVTSLTVVGIIMAGWASNNKYALYGGMRGAAQIVSYEIPSALAIMTIVIQVGSLSMQDIVNAQRGGLFHWFIFRNPFNFVAFFVYFLCSLAEANRTPFDIPECESELVAGYHTEYSGFRFALFFLAEYANMFVVASIATTLFLGGWSQVLPLSHQYVPGPILFTVKALLLVFVQMWLRWSLPRLRVDQLMYMCWKVMIPLAFALILGVGGLSVFWK